MATHSSLLGWIIPRAEESDMTEATYMHTHTLGVKDSYCVFKGENWKNSANDYGMDIDSGLGCEFVS